MIRSKPENRSDQPATTIATAETAKRQLMAREEPRCREPKPSMVLNPESECERWPMGPRTMPPSISQKGDDREEKRDRHRTQQQIDVRQRPPPPGGLVRKNHGPTPLFVLLGRDDLLCSRIQPAVGLERIAPLRPRRPHLLHTPCQSLLLGGSASQIRRKSFETMGL